MKHLVFALAALLLTGCQLGSQPDKQKVPAFFTTSLGAPTGWRIKEVRGFECRFFEYAGSNDYLDRFKGVLRGIADDGKKSGANAFLNARVSAESHEAPATKAQMSIVHVCGDYVIIE